MKISADRSEVDLQINAVRRDGKQGNKMTDTKVKFEGETRGFCGGAGNSASTKCGTEQHGQKRNQGKVVKQDSPISKQVKNSADSLLDESKVSGTSNREIGPVEAVRRANNHSRDKITNLGKGKPTGIVTE